MSAATVAISEEGIWQAKGNPWIIAVAVSPLPARTCISWPDQTMAPDAELRAVLCSRGTHFHNISSEEFPR